MTIKIKGIQNIFWNFKAGNGGSGCYSFHRDAKVKSGAPDGGDGGAGGSFYLKASSRFKDLKILKLANLQGNNGKSGQRGKKDGAKGKDIYYSVP